MTDQYIQLRDGRRLAFTEHGDPGGKPVFFLHGNPGSRLTRHPDESIAEALGARIITPDRPGYGLSDHQPGRTLTDWPDDMAQLADELGITQFAVAGWSAGGAYALASMAAQPDRVLKGATISGAAPMDRPGAYEGMHPSYQGAFKLARWPWLFKMLLWPQNWAAVRTPEKALAQTASQLSDDDQAMLFRPDIKPQAMRYRSEATRSGINGVVREARILASPWVFRLEDIQQPVKLWCWAGDVIVPPQMGRYLAERIPRAEVIVLPGGGHFAWFDYWRGILGWLMAE
jgi:pimeloyl-ACP methyl ester carboxylesterase